MIRTKKMTTVVQPVVSGKVNSAVILTTVIDQVEYYLTSDVNSVPFFMPFRTGLTSGLDTFTNYALQVTMTLALSSSTGPVMTLRNASTNQFYIVEATSNYISSPDPQVKQYSISLVTRSGADNTLLAGGISYKLTSPNLFYVLNSNITNPNSINIISSSPSSVDNFFITQVSNLVDQNGNPATKNIFSSIYSFMTDDGGSISHFFTSVQDAINGNYIPYNFCPTQTCGTNCLGPCNGNDYNTCKRQVSNEEFSCVDESFGGCMFTYFAIALVIDLVFLMIFAYIMFSHHFGNSSQKGGEDKYAAKIFSKHKQGAGLKITVSILFTLFALFPIFLILLIQLVPSFSRALLGQTCNIV